MLYLVLTHRPPEEVARHLGALGRALPGRRFAVLYGGTPEDFAALPVQAKAFVADPSLRGPAREQSYVELLRVAWEAFVAPDDSVELVHLVEFDHAIASERYEHEVLRALDATGADFLGGICVDRSETNWWHAIAVLADDELRGFLRDLSGEADPRLFGGIANAVTFRRRALEAFATLPRHLHRYCELYVPTVLHHLGFAIGDASAVSTVFDWVRWTPDYTAAELAALPEDAVAAHPVKDVELIEAFVRAR
jgi:hypothetical protein